MRGNELLNKMELAAPRFIGEADKIPSKRVKSRIKWIAAAACLCIAAAGAFMTFRISRHNTLQTWNEEYKAKDIMPKERTEYTGVLTPIRMCILSKNMI